MKNAEIRIGNLIASGKEYKSTSVVGRVIAIEREESDFEQIEVECEESFDWFFKDDYCGIPLTPEWLTRFGFKESYAGMYLENPTPYNFVFVNGTIYYNTIPIECKCVHTLQNLYFALTGIELTLKP